MVFESAGAAESGDGERLRFSELNKSSTSAQRRFYAVYDALLT